MAHWDFPASDPLDLRVRIPAGSVTVLAAAAQRATVTIDGGTGGKAERFLAATRVEFDDGALSVIAPEKLGLGLGRNESLDVTVNLPEGSSCLIHTASADVRCTGRLSAIDVHTASGDVIAQQVTEQAKVVTASGDVHIAEAAEVNADSASGDVGIGRASGPVAVRTASGDVQIAEASGSRVDVKSASGDIGVAVAPGIGVYLDLSTLSGTVSSELEATDEGGGTDLSLHCRTLSGDVQVTRAARAAAR